MRYKWRKIMADIIRPEAFQRPTSAEPQTFADEATRLRLTPAAMTAFRGLVEAWKLSGVEAAALLTTSTRSWDRMKRSDWQGVLNQDQLTRISAMVGVFKGLHLLFADGFADRWPRLPNAGALFEGRSAIEAMLHGGIPRMIEVRRHIDALRGGL